MTIDRASRLVPEPRSSAEVTGEHSQYRLDLERIRFSPYFSRLSAVTQVIAQPGAGPLIHNRLTHSIKVTAVARAIDSPSSCCIYSRRYVMNRYNAIVIMKRDDQA